MAFLSYAIAASQSQQPFDKQKLQTLIEALVREHILTFPAAVFVGEARNGTDPEVGENWKYIVPNSPDSMLHVMNALFKRRASVSLPPYVRYCGNDEHEFSTAFHQIPFQEQSSCICLTAHQEKLRGWEGAVIYTLTHPFPMEFMDPNSPVYWSLVDRPLAHYLSLYCLRGWWLDESQNVVKSFLESYFGSYMIFVQSTGPNSPFKEYHFDEARYRKEHGYEDEDEE